MGTRQVACPACKSVLSVPPGYGGRRVRCGRCHQPFVIPQSQAVTEDDILAWLDEEEDQVAAGQRQTVGAGAAARQRGGGSVTATVSPSRAAVTKAQSAKEARPAPERIKPKPGPIRVVRIDHSGVLFEFPVSRLLEPPFRCSMPRRCLRCGTKVHLQAHVIRYTAQSLEGLSLKAEHAAGALVLREKDPHRLSDEKLLKRLPTVPNVPKPADTPMPYWLCDMCSGTDIISGRIQVNTATGQGRCRLMIQSLRRAQEFLASAGGPKAEGFDELVERIEANAEKPWDRLPLMVQERLKQWFKPLEGEGFIAYVPDRDRARTEDGVAGLVVSNQRFIYHTPMRHREADISTPLQLQLGMTGRTGDLKINAGAWKIKHFTVDRQGLNRLRRALSAAKFPAVWR